MTNSDVFEMELSGLRMTGKPPNTRWNVQCRNGCINSIILSDSPTQIHNGDQLISPSLCHPHIHLDKCFLLSHPRYADLEVQKGDFAEALSITNKAKSRFTHEDLLERGRALIDESINFGVTHMRAFVEVDQGVEMKCLDAGLALKEEYRDRCHVQICVFAQDPIFSYDDEGKAMIDLLEKALSRPGVDVFGSTPYVEKSDENQIRNIKWTLKACLERKLHVDFHMDYNLDPKKDVFTLVAIRLAKEFNWPVGKDSKTIVFGHCTRLSLFTQAEWRSIKNEIGLLPVHFVGLPTSDLFMMGRPEKHAGGGERVRATLQVLQMIKDYGLDAAIGINNVGNAFTPQGSCDPLALASLGVGVYQAGTTADAELLLQCVSTRAKAAIGLGSVPLGGRWSEGDHADFVVFGDSSKIGSFRCRKTVQDLAYDAGHERQTIFGGQLVSR